MKRSHVLLVLLGLMFPSLAYADLTIKAYQDLQQGSPADKKMVEMYIGGTAKGYLWANMVLVQKGQSPLFCFDGDLHTSQANKIAGEGVARALSKGLKSDTPVELLLLLELQQRYPCATGQTH